MRLLAIALLSLFVAAPAFASGTLRIGLNEDPDALDPTTGGSFSGRIVFAATCDKLIDLDTEGDLVPQLATSWQWSPDARPRAPLPNASAIYDLLGRTQRMNVSPGALLPAPSGAKTNLLEPSWVTLPTSGGPSC